jgi:hypothetical protein
VSLTFSGAAHRGLPAGCGVSRGVNSSDNTGRQRVNTPRFHVDCLSFRRLIGKFPRETPPKSFEAGRGVAVPEWAKDGNRLCTTFGTVRGNRWTEFRLQFTSRVELGDAWKNRGAARLLTPEGLDRQVSLVRESDHAVVEIPSLDLYGILVVG